MLVCRLTFDFLFVSVHASVLVVTNQPGKVNEGPMHKEVLAKLGSINTKTLVTSHLCKTFMLSVEWSIRTPGGSYRMA